jgi:hypothetical protein
VQPPYQIDKVALQILGIFCFGHFIDAGSCILAQPLKASPQQLLVHQMVQSGELETRSRAGFLCYAL